MLGPHFLNHVKIIAHAYFILEERKREKKRVRRAPGASIVRIHNTHKGLPNQIIHVSMYRLVVYIITQDEIYQS